MVKYKVGDEINDSSGCKVVDKISNDGNLIVSDQEGKDYTFYNKDNDIMLKKNEIRGIVVKLSKTKKFNSYISHFFNNKTQAKYWVKNKVKNTNLFYRVEDCIIRGK